MKNDAKSEAMKTDQSRKALNATASSIDRLRKISSAKTSNGFAIMKVRAGPTVRSIFGYIVSARKAGYEFLKCV